MATCYCKGSLGLAYARYVQEQSGIFPSASREYFIRPYANSSEEQKIIKTVDLTFCKVWHINTEIMDILCVFIILIFPLIFGPVCTAFFELLDWMTSCNCDCQEWEVQWCQKVGLLHALGWASFVTYVTNLYFAEGILFRYFNFSTFHILIFKYVFGAADLIYVPIIIICMEAMIPCDLQFFLVIRAL